MTKVTYIPREPTDPGVLIWNGVEFPANVPVDLDPVKHSYMVPLPKTIVDPVTGREMKEFKETRVAMAELAKGNLSFHVDGVPPVLEQMRRPSGRPRNPKTSGEYRGYAMAWITNADDPDELLQRWEDEGPLRERCTVGDDDISYLRPFFDAKLHQLGGGPESSPMKMVMAE